MSIILYLILFVFLIVFFVIFSLGISILRIFMRKPKQNYYSNSEKRDFNDSSSKSATQNKVFGPDEGEYVDYEDVE